VTNHLDNRNTVEGYRYASSNRPQQRIRALLLAACAFAAGAPVWAQESQSQDVADAARQEQARKERKEKEANRVQHVYTDDDLKQPQILTPEDRELLAAKKRAQPGPAQPADEIDAQTLDQLPLGDVARMFRALKELKTRDRESAQFHLPGANPVLASPKPEFMASKPRSVQPVTRGTPKAPEFPNATLTAPKAPFAYPMPKPNSLQPSIRRDPMAPVFANSSARSLAARPGLSVVTPSVPRPAMGSESSVPAVAQRQLAPSKPAFKFAIPKPSAVQPPVRVQPTAPAFPNAAAPASVTVKRGDSFWKLAQVILGDGHRWHEIAAANPAIVDPNHILPGTPLNIARPEPVAPAAPARPSDSRFMVRRGDTLWHIAQTRLGAGGFYGCIAKANPRIVDANRIYAGQVLTLPSNCGTSPTE
jgi:nucleoid-associated protein YgaU